VRNDIEWLRILGYESALQHRDHRQQPAWAGSAMPPLLLDDDQAVTMAVRCAGSGRSSPARPRHFLVIFRLLWGSGPDAHLCSAAAAVPVHPGIGEAVRKAAVCERAGLLGSPAVTGEARSARSGQPFDGHQPAAGL
jgi:hypothetical protein